MGNWVRVLFYHPRFDGSLKLFRVAFLALSKKGYPSKNNINKRPVESWRRLLYEILQYYHQVHSHLGSQTL